MKSINLIFGLLAISVMFFSCSDDPIIDDDLIIDDDEDPDPIENIVESSELDFHNPSSIALVSVNSNSVKKGLALDEEEDLYYLYEIANDSFRMVSSTEGDEIYFSGVGEILKINDEWQILITNYKSGPVMKIYRSHGDSSSSELIKSLIFNMQTGEMYNIDEYVNYIFNSPMNKLIPLQSNSQENTVTFHNAYESVCKLNLINLSVEKFQLPIEQLDHNEGWWVQIENRIIYSPGHNGSPLYCYTLGGGVTTKTNAIDDYQYEESMVTWSYKNTTYFKFNEPEYSDSLKYYGLEIRNDSMIFSPFFAYRDPRCMSVDHYDLGDQYAFGRNIVHNDTIWHRSERAFWTINFETNNYKCFRATGFFEDVQYVSNGEFHFGFIEDKVFRYDFNSMEEIELVRIDANFRVDGISVGSESNVYVSGLRFSDLRDVIMEYDGLTGAKLNEWVSEEAPPQSTIVYLSPM